MATETRATGTGIPLYRLTVRQYVKMIVAGVFPEGAHVELLGGMLVDKMTKSTPHDFAVGLLGDSLRGILPPDWFIREEKSLVLGRYWRPEPDLAVVRGPRDRFRAKDTRAADLALLIEVAESSYREDRGVKWQRYAASGVPAYWIVHIAGRRVEVYGDPAGRGPSAAYRDARVFGEDEQVPVVIEGRVVGQIVVKDLLP